MFDEEVSGADFAVGLTCGLGIGGSGVVGGHEEFEFLGVGFCWGVPTRLMAAVVEVVREVFGVGVADFPVRGQAGVGGGLRVRVSVRCRWVWAWIYRLMWYGGWSLPGWCLPLRMVCDFFSFCPGHKYFSQQSPKHRRCCRSEECNQA